MPNRIIHESALTSRSLDRVSDGAERLFWRLVTVADDHGRFDAEPSVVLARCFDVEGIARALCDARADGFRIVADEEAPEVAAAVSRFLLGEEK